MAVCGSLWCGGVCVGGRWRGRGRTGASARVTADHMPGSVLSVGAAGWAALRCCAPSFPLPPCSLCLCLCPGASVTPACTCTLPSLSQAHPQAQTPSLALSTLGTPQRATWQPHHRSLHSMHSHSAASPPSLPLLARRASFSEAGQPMVSATAPAQAAQTQDDLRADDSTPSRFVSPFGYDHLDFQRSPDRHQFQVHSRYLRIQQFI